MAILARAAVALREPHAAAGLAAAHHRARVGTRGGDHATGQLDIGEEALVAPDEAPLDERARVPQLSSRRLAARLAGRRAACAPRSCRAPSPSRPPARTHPAAARRAARTR